MADRVTLPVQELDAVAFAPFGRTIAMPDRSHDASGPGWRWWAETLTLEGDGRAWGVGYLDLAHDRPPSFDWAERHLRSPEAIVPVAGTCLVYVAPPDHPDEPDRLPAFDAFRVFRVPPGAGVVMDPAVWHGAPLSDGGPAKAIVLLLEGTGDDDVTLVRFGRTPVRIGEG